MLPTCRISRHITTFPRLPNRLFNTSAASFTRSKLQHHMYPIGLSFEEEYNTRSSLERLITQYSHYNVPQISLNSLIELSRKDHKTNAIATINYLIILNTKRLAAFRALPYLVVLNPHISETYALYLNSFRLLLETTKEIKSLAEFDPLKVHHALLKFADIHRDAIPSLSRGFQEVSGTFPGATKEKIVEFLNKHFSDKINMETMTTNFIQSIDKPNDDYCGIINKKLKISELLSIYAGFVNDMTFIKYYKTVPIQVDFGEDLTFPYIGHHLEYIFTEILKNSMRAHIETGNSEKPVKITIVENKSDDGKRSLGIRFRDQGGGIPPEIEGNIFDYSFTSVEDAEKDGGMSDNTIPGEDINSVAGMGYGLPLTKAYVEQFGGSLELQSCFGLGTDVYVELIGPDSALL